MFSTNLNYFALIQLQTHEIFVQQKTDENNSVKETMFHHNYPTNNLCICLCRRSIPLVHWNCLSHYAQVCTYTCVSYTSPSFTCWLWAYKDYLHFGFVAFFHSRFCSCTFSTKNNTYQNVYIWDILVYILQIPLRQLMCLIKLF